MGGGQRLPGGFLLLFGFCRWKKYLKIWYPLGNQVFRIDFLDITTKRKGNIRLDSGTDL